MDQPQLKKRSDLHIARKLWHFGGVSLTLYLYLHMTQIAFIQLVITFASLTIFVDLLRLKNEKLNRFILKFAGPLMRQSEAHALSGISYMVIGVFLTVALFYRWPKVVVLSLLFLATADPLASYFGIRFGRDKLFGRKSLQGTLAAFIVCTLVSGGFYLIQNTMTERLLVVSVVSGFAGALAEAIPVGKLDDNLVLPVMSASMLWVIFFVFGGF